MTAKITMTECADTGRAKIIMTEPLWAETCRAKIAITEQAETCTGLHALFKLPLMCVA